MSFEIYVNCFRRGEPGGIPRSAVQAFFPIVDAESEPDYWSVRYDDRNSCQITVTPCDSSHELVTSLCIHRPCGDGRLWDALFSVMKLGAVVLYLPADTPPLVVDNAAIAHLPVEMIEALGDPVCVKSGKEILATIQSA